MDRKTYFSVSAVLFLIIVIGHGLRVLQGWDVTIGGWMLPTWISYVAIALGAYLAWTGYNFRK
ncbi:hypothetical protein A3A35_00110 [Candidatus Kaiserbacteria bacterium RIFCSPLOWO2_01_FULL_51_21]|uniref:Uncharacterized protein n=1 Tax=Candidatus Kaiserbacteria bacterium RIFCSPLOWO2_01_FULL_51_21 TaxID=1798508 RepID=A0A1F6ED10_9BACT|nr:MAG: hypothetical protein A3A35_00110 [Candidatus Kaiserbacteria bacterium RIFCSPLOWO2_01_FULL_51_21]